jgi:hypothetical protein
MAASRILEMWLASALHSTGSVTRGRRNHLFPDELQIGHLAILLDSGLLSGYNLMVMTVCKAWNRRVSTLFPVKDAKEL